MGWDGKKCGGFKNKVMTKDIRTHLNSTYVVYSNKLRMKEVIQVYVEDEIDKIFWYTYLRPYEISHKCKFRISALQERNKILKGKAALLSYKRQDDLGHNMWLCIDSDYDELITNFSDFSERIRHDNYVITTHWYSIENLKCTPELLEINILKASLADRCDVVVSDILQTISVLYKNMFLLLLEMKEKHDGRFNIEDFCKNLSFICFSDGKLDEERINCKIQEWYNSHIDLYRQYENRFNHWCARLKKLGYKDTDYYKLYNGHGLFKNIAVPLVKQFAYIYRKAQLNTIVKGADRKERKSELVTEYHNNTFTYFKEPTSLSKRVEQLITDNQPSMDNDASLCINEQIKKALSI